MLQLIALLLINLTLSTIAVSNPAISRSSRNLLTCWNLILLLTLTFKEYL